MAAPYQNYDGARSFRSGHTSRVSRLHQRGNLQSLSGSSLVCWYATVHLIAVLAVCASVCFSSSRSTRRGDHPESNATWGTSTKGYLTPQKVTADEQIMTILHRGFAYAVDDLSAMGTGADPMAAIRGYLTRAILKLRTTTLISQCDGLFGTALADSVVDIGADAGTADESNYLTACLRNCSGQAGRARQRHHRCGHA